MCRIAVVATLLLFCTGCAVFNEDNRLTLNALDEHLAPDSSAARWALAPMGFPLGIVAGVVDLVIVHPATVFDDAWGDTVQLLWTPRDESRFRRAVMLPLVTIATPFVYVGDWLLRSLFDVPPRESG
jgi:hypothetical protein